MKPVTPLSPKLKIFPVIMMAVMGLLVICFGCWMIHMAFAPRYPQLFGILGGLFMSGLGIGLLIYLLRTRIFVPGAYQFTVRTMLGRELEVIGYDEIISYSEYISKQKQTEVMELTIWYRESKISMSSSLIANYTECKLAIVRGKTRNTAAEARWKQKKAAQSGYGLVVIGMMLALIALVAGSGSDNTPVSASSLSTVTDVITNEVKITKGSKGARSIHIELARYPEFDFCIKNQQYKACYDQDYISYVTTGDTLSLDIDQDEFLKKLARTKPLSFWDKSVGYTTIDVYGLRDKSHDYLKPDDYNKLHSTKSGWIVTGIFGCLALLLLGNGIRSVQKAGKMNDTTLL